MVGRRTGGIAVTALSHDDSAAWPDVTGTWTGQGFIDWEGINFNGRHVVHPRTVGDPLFETADVYGNGAMEKLLGDTLDVRTTQVVTKLGTVRGERLQAMDGVTRRFTQHRN